jgi:hypothetical protein
MPLLLARSLFPPSVGIPEVPGTDRPQLHPRPTQLILAIRALLPDREFRLRETQAWPARQPKRALEPPLSLFTNLTDPWPALRNTCSTVHNLRAHRRVQQPHCFDRRSAR